MGLSLTFLGRNADRWRVRVVCDEGFEPLGLTVALMSESGRLLGPAVVVPRGTRGCMTAELRGPTPLPLGTLMVATADTQEGATFQVAVPVDTRRGLHAFLHADGRLPLETNPSGSALSRRELTKLAVRFPWVKPCCEGAEGAAVGGGGAHSSPQQEDADQLRAMLQNEFDIDPEDIPDELTDELLQAMRR